MILRGEKHFFYSNDREEIGRLQLTILAANLEGRIAYDILFDVQLSRESKRRSLRLMSHTELLASGFKGIRDRLGSRYFGLVEPLQLLDIKIRSLK